MMVEQSHYVDNLGQLLNDLDQAAAKLNEITEKKQAVSKQDLNDLIHALKNFNTTLDPSFWENKKLAPEEGMNTTVEKAIKALDLFKRTASKNVEQAIVSLFATLASELNVFDKNLIGLKELKLGRKVEKSGESKRA